MKLSNLELYGTNDVPEIPADIIMRRIELLKDRRFELYEVDLMKRDDEIIRKVEKAIGFWEKAGEV